mmetsp:Transcript_24207/g.63127  ORF Transcript_24207/g.63127 Transcript_24207/m.63127 type:complete len:331 (-) Transcript_24207:75-1067(-)
MPRTWTSEVALASGGVALSVAAGALGAKLAGAVDRPELSAAIRRFIAAGISGAVAKTVTAPLEAIKLKLQYTEDDDEGALDCARRILEREGWRGFYRGNLANVLRYFPTQAFNFAFKDTIKGFFPKYSPKTDFGKSFAVNVASGGLAGAGSLTIVYPLDYARTRLASDVGSGKAQFNGLIDCLSKTASGPAGPLGLYNGFGVSVVGIVPFRGTYFGVNDTLVSINPYQKDKGLVGIASKFACAQTAALCAAYASYPFDTVRRRLQMQSEKPQEEWVYKGTMDCFGKIAAEEGVGALFKGAGANALRTVGSALVLVMYGELKGILAGAAGK